jgi:hypothetical protein
MKKMSEEILCLGRDLNRGRPEIFEPGTSRNTTFGLALCSTGPLAFAAGINRRKVSPWSLDRD